MDKKKIQIIFLFITIIFLTGCQREILLIQSTSNASNNNFDNITAKQIKSITSTTTIGEHAITAYMKSNLTDTVALNVVSDNVLMSSAWFSGKENDTGTVKILHNAVSNDNTSSGLSIELAGSTTASQGIFLDIGNSTGDALTITDGTNSHFVIKDNGRTIITSTDSEAFLIQKEDGTDIFKVATSSSVSFIKKLIPISSNFYDLGDNTHIWNTFYVNNIKISGNLTTGGNAGTHICVDANNDLCICGTCA